MKKPKRKRKAKILTMKSSIASMHVITQGVYDQGKMLKTNKINVMALPKFFKRGMELNKSKEKTTSRRTDRSLIVDKYKELLTQKEHEQQPVEPPRPPPPRRVS